MVSFPAFQTSARESSRWFNFHVFAAVLAGVFKGNGSQLVIFCLLQTRTTSLVTFLLDPLRAGFSSSWKDVILEGLLLADFQYCWLLLGNTVCDLQSSHKVLTSVSLPSGATSKPFPEKRLSLIPESL